MSNDKTEKFLPIAEQIVQAHWHAVPNEPSLQQIIACGIYDAVAQTLAQVAPAFEQAGHGHVNIQWESVMGVIEIPTLREGWEMT